MVTETSPASVTCELVPVAGMNLQALRNSGKGWLVIKHVCKMFGLNDRSQRRRIESSSWSVGAVMALTVTATDGKSYDTLCLDVSKAAIWLATIETSRMKDEHARRDMERLQAEAADALDLWFRGPQVAPAPALVVPPQRWTAEDPLEMFEYALQNMKRTRAELAQVAATQKDHGARLALVENNQRKAATEIELVSPAQPELPAISKRRLITEHVNRYAAAMNMSQHETWRLLYYHVNRRLSISVYSYKLGPKETKLDRLESLGLLDRVGKVCDTDLQIPAERMRWLSAPVSQAVL